MTLVFNKWNPFSGKNAVSVAAAAGVTALIALVFALEILLGAPVLSPAQVIAAISNSAHPDHISVVQVRLPRAVAAVLVGASLGIVGLMLQDVLRNPLAGPELTGAGPGAAFGLAAVTVLAPTVGWGMRTAAVLCAAIVVGAVVAAISTRIRDPLAVAVAGAMVAAVVSALTIGVISLASETSVGFFYRVMLGSIAGRTWDDLFPLVVALIVAVASAVVLARRLEAVRLGDAVAGTLGVRPGLVRGVVFAVSAVVTTAIVLVCGSVAFVALAAPHIARWLACSGRTAYVLPLAALVGVLLVSCADCAAKFLAAPGEIPLGVATAVLGGPILLLMLRRVRG